LLRAISAAVDGGNGIILKRNLKKFYENVD
jgi:hypothetical protein